MFCFSRIKRRGREGKDKEGVPERQTEKESRAGKDPEISVAFMESCSGLFFFIGTVSC